jgi:hypothetical protein
MMNILYLGIFDVGGTNLEGTLSELSSLLLELLDGTLVDTTALVDQVTSGGGLAGIDVSDNDDVNVSLLFSHARKW